MPDPMRSRLLGQALRLQAVTVVWMAGEAAVAAASGIAAHSITLLAFGIDSVIELASASVLAWRLATEARHGRARSENAERVAGRIAGGLLFALAVYIVAAAGWRLWTQEGADFSWPGLIIAALAMPTMYAISRRKLFLAEQLGSAALRADAVEAIACGWLSLVVVAGQLAQLAFGFWWIDAVASLGLVFLLAKEGREAWEGSDCCG